MKSKISPFAFVAAGSLCVLLGNLLWLRAQKDQHNPFEGAKLQLTYLTAGLFVVSSTALIIEISNGKRSRKTR